MVAVRARAGRRLVAIGFSAAVIVSGCSSTDTTDASQEATGSEEAVASGAFPVTVESVYGPVTVESKPERIVTFGEVPASLLVSLGEQPAVVGVEEASLEDKPWLDGVFTGEFEDVWARDSALEAVAAHEPDLILPVGTYDVTEDEYPDYQAIAPTFVGTTENISPQVELLEAYGELLGKPEEAAAVIAETDEAFESVRQNELAGLQGKTYTFATLGDDGIFTMPNASAIEYFGLVPSDIQDNSWSLTEIAHENISQLDADVVFLGVWDEDRDRLLQDPLFQQLTAAQNNSVVWMPASNRSLNLAVYEGSPLSLEYMREGLTPLLAEVGANQTG